MNDATSRRTPSLDWLRVGAWSGSLAAHVVVLLLVALPMTVPPLRPPETTLVARWIESEPPPPALPEPPPPSVPHHERSVPAHTVPVSVVPAATHDPAPPNPIPEAATPPHAPDAPVATTDIGSGGATQTLAYATPLSPKYPPASMHAREQGTVILRVLVDENGVPKRIEIARSSGHARLDAAARESVERARFRPVMRNGVAAPAWGLVPIAFRLDQG